MINSQFEKIRNWSLARNITHGSTPQAQFVKLIEEIGELAEGIAKSRKDAVVDGIGDAVVVLTILAAQHGVSIEQCIETAWGEIQHRKGKLVNGTWIKEGD